MHPSGPARCTQWNAALLRRTHIIGIKAESADGGGIQSMRTNHCPLRPPPPRLLRTPLRTAPRDHQPPTANSHQPPTATNRQPPTATNRRQPPAATNRQLPTTANRHQPSITNHQPPPSSLSSPSFGVPPPPNRHHRPGGGGERATARGIALCAAGAGAPRRCSVCRWSSCARSCGSWRPRGTWTCWGPSTEGCAAWPTTTGGGPRSAAGGGRTGS